MAGFSRKPRELDDAAIEALVQTHLERTNDPMCTEWLNACLDRFETKSVAEAVRQNTQELVLPLIYRTQKVFDILWEPTIAWLALPSPHFAAVASRHQGGHVVLVHEGLLTLLRLWSIQQVLLGGAAAYPEEEDRHPLGLTIAACCTGLSLAFMEKPIRLPRWDWRLPADQRLLAFQTYVAMLAFVLAHEMSHHRLGHSRSNLKFDPARPLASRHMLLNEELYFTQDHEFDADCSALSTARKSRELFQLGAQIFLDHLASAQAVLGKTAKTHPFAANRLSEMHQQLDSNAHELVLREFEKSRHYADEYRQNERLGRDKVIDGFRIDVGRAHHTMDVAVAQIFGNDYKLELIRKLLRGQCDDLPDERIRAECRATVDNMDEMNLLGSGMATVVTIVEAFQQHRYFGISTRESLARIAAQRDRTDSGPNFCSTNIEGFIRQRIALEHGGFSLGDAQLKLAVEQATNFFGW